MKLKVTISILAIMTVIIMMDALTNEGKTASGGAVSGVTGSPSDGFTCAASGCHTGSAVVPEIGWVKSNAPATGYVAGHVYVITAKAKFASRVKFGFEISPQNNAGTLQGTLAITDGTRTQFTGTGNKWITHKTAGTTNSGADSIQWSFNWTAPASGTGPVTFYAAFNCANNDGSRSGDIICTSTLVIPDSMQSAGVPVIESNRFNLSVFPNPATNVLNVGFSLEEQDLVTIKMYDMYGKLVDTFLNETKSVGEYKMAFDLKNHATGIYFLHLSAGEKSEVSKVFVQ